MIKTAFLDVFRKCCLIFISNNIRCFSSLSLAAETSFHAIGMARYGISGVSRSTPPNMVLAGWQWDGVLGLSDSLTGCSGVTALYRSSAVDKERPTKNTAECFSRGPSRQEIIKMKWFQGKRYFYTFLTERSHACKVSWESRLSPSSVSPDGDFSDGVTRLEDPESS